MIQGLDHHSYISRHRYDLLFITILIVWSLLSTGCVSTYMRQAERAEAQRVQAFRIAASAVQGGPSVEASIDLVALMDRLFAKNSEPFFTWRYLRNSAIEAAIYSAAAYAIDETTGGSGKSGSADGTPPALPAIQQHTASGNNTINYYYSGANGGSYSASTRRDEGQ